MKELTSRGETIDFAGAHLHSHSTFAKEMKFIFAILLLTIGFASGWMVSNQRMNQKIEEKFPSEMEEALSELSEMIGPMTKEDVREVMEQIQAFSENALSEFDQMSLWEGTTSYQILNIEKEEGIESARSFARSRILNFRDNYERGMKVGAWTEMADKIYQNTNHLKSEPVDTDNQMTRP